MTPRYIENAPEYFCFNYYFMHKKYFDRYPASDLVARVL